MKLPAPIRMILKPLSSLKLTVLLLTLTMLLVFFGTLAQVEHGIYYVQKEIFHAFWVWSEIPGTDLRIPVFPGGYVLGGLLLINLIAAHASRFSLTPKKIGINLIHLGLIILIAGELVTSVVQVDSQMRIREGESSNFAEDIRTTELSVVRPLNESEDEVFVFPQPTVAQGGTLEQEGLPFEIEVRRFFENASIRLRPETTLVNEAIVPKGVGSDLIVEEKPRAAGMNEMNFTSAVVDIVRDGRVLETLFLSNVLDEQPVTIGDETWYLAMRQQRYYRPFEIRLNDFIHELHPGTSIPETYSSKITLIDEANHEERDIHIEMNKPLRYAGETYYQASFDDNGTPDDPADDVVTVFQVVRNPGASLPYIACALVTLGLLYHFMLRLVGFGRKTRTPVTA